MASVLDMNGLTTINIFPSPNSYFSERKQEEEPEEEITRAGQKARPGLRRVCRLQSGWGPGKTIHAGLGLMQVSFVRRTSWPPGMVRHCTDVRHPFIRWCTLRQKQWLTIWRTFTHICVKIMMHHFMKMTDPWRTSFCAHRNDGPIDGPCDALTVKWLTKTHIWVIVVTNLVLPWRYYASSIWQYMTHPWRTIPGVKRCVLQMTPA